MKHLVPILSLVAAASLAAAAQSMPACASHCLINYLASSSCASTDYTCICADTALLGNVTTCTLGSCTVIEALSAQNVTSTLCDDPVRDITLTTPIICGIWMALAIISVIMRLADSLSRNTLVHWSNIAVILGLLCGIVMGGLEFPMSAAGFGKDIWTLPPDDITTIVKFTWLTEIFYMGALGFTKIGILGFYLRVFPGEAFRKVCWVTIAICAAYIPAFSFATIFHCTPISYEWTSWTGETVGHCMNFNSFAWAHAIINIILDLFIMVMPLRQIWQLNMGRRSRVMLMIMFCVGTFITVFSIVRLSALVQFATTTNPTYDNVPTAYWSVLEAFVSIICCCLPAVRSLLRSVFPSCFGSTDAASAPTPTPRSWDPSRNRRNKSMGGIQKSMSTTVSFSTRTGDMSSDVELVERGYEGRWAKIPE